MEAICKADYDQRVQTSSFAEKEIERRKKEADEAERLKRRAESRSPTQKRKANESKETVPDEDEQEQEITITRVGFYDCYGVWFFGQLTDNIRQIAKNRFNAELHKMMHVYIDVESKNLTDGVHEIIVYGHSCRLYKWTAQGYHRGLVVLAEDDSANQSARVYMESGTWSWQLNDKDTDRLRNMVYDK